MREVVIEHTSGIHLLLGPPSLEVAQGIRPEALYTIMSGLRRMYDHIVVDAGSYLNDNTVTLLDTADRVLLVATPDLAALHDATRFVQLSRTLAYPPGKVAIVLNRAGLLGGVKTADIETALRHEVFAHIPDDGPTAQRSLNRGIPLILKYPRSPVSRAIQKLARDVIAAEAGEPAGATAGKAKATGRWRSRLASPRAGKATAS